MNPSGLRIGHGFDVHRFSEHYLADKPLRLAGLTLAEEVSLLAHSDGDIVLHALCDAILGAVGEGDIGQHFPDDDAAWAGADSVRLLEKVLALAQQRGATPVNVDITVVSQIPKLAPHRERLKANLAGLLGLPPAQINLKATTTEGLGYIGRKEGMACHCVVLMAIA